MLNPNWKKLPYEKDLKLWLKLVYELKENIFQAERFFDMHEKEINYLFNFYYATINGGNPNRGIRQKFEILQKDKVFENLQLEINNLKEKSVKEWNNRQEKDESLDARLEREKGNWESVEASLRISLRD